MHRRQTPVGHIDQCNLSEIEEKSEREKKIEEWLPINANRNAKWWYSAFHNVTAMVGAGVLGLPYAMSQLGWYIYFKLILLFIIS